MSDELFPPYPPKEIRHEPHPAEKAREIFGIMAAVGWPVPQKTLGQALAEELEGAFEPDEQKEGKKDKRMDNEQRKRMATREFIGTDPEQREISYSVQVSGGRAWLRREWEEEWDNAEGTGRDTGRDCWTMSTDDLKSLIKSAQWCLEKSEAFEAACPAEEKTNV